jgi:hypothetical protein
MALSAQTITSSFRSVATGNAALIASLGSATSASIIHAQTLATTRATDIVLPTPVFIAFRSGAIPGARYDARSLFYTWYVYDTPDQGFWRINGVLPLLEAAYPRTAISMCETDVVSIGAETLDSALDLLVRSIQFIVKTRR